MATMCLFCIVFEILSFISHNVMRSRDPEHMLSAVVYHSCTCTPLYQ